MDGRESLTSGQNGIMKFYPLWTVFLLHILSCQIRFAHAQLDTAIVSASVIRSGLGACQRCIILEAGATHAKVVSSKKQNDEIAVSRAQFKVTGSAFCFAIVRQFCEDSRLCESLKVATIFVSNPYFNMPVSHLGADINVPSLAIQASPEQIQDKEEIVCILRFYTSAACRTCLRQSSDAKHFGTFYIKSDATTRMILNVFSTSKSVKDILALCFASAACGDSTLQIPSEKCEQLIPEGPMRRIDPNNYFGFFSFGGNGLSKGFRKVRTQLIRNTLRKDICIQVKFPNRSGTLSWIKCLVETTGGIVAILQQKNALCGSKIIQSVKIITQDSISTGDCNAKYGAEPIQMEEVESCNQLSKEYFDEPLLTDQMTIGMKKGLQRMQKNVRIQFSSKCIWVHHDVIDKACTTCISAMTQSSEHTGQLAGTARLTPQTFLAMLREGVRDETLSECVITSKESQKTCSRITFVPNFMCEHEFTQSKSSNHIDSSESQLGAELLPSYARNGAGEDSQHHRGPTGQAIRLFGVDIAPDAGMQESREIKHTRENSELTRYVAPIEHVMSSESKRSCLEPSVLLVDYIGEKAQDCFVSLALAYDVVIFSMRRHYVWMLCEPGYAFGTKYCPNLRILKRLQHKSVGSMRSLPAESILVDFEGPTKSLKRKRGM